MVVSECTACYHVVDLILCDYMNIFALFRGCFNTENITLFYDLACDLSVKMSCLLHQRQRLHKPVIDLSSTNMAGSGTVLPDASVRSSSHCFCRLFCRRRLAIGPIIISSVSCGVICEHYFSL